MVKMDLTDMSFPDEFFSLVWCSHVLEHIPEDAKALHELHRVCKPQGRVVIQVPIWRQVTFEDPQITEAEDRLTHFYQRDHVRLYGLDFVDKLADAGFYPEVRRAQQFDPSLICRHALSFVCTNEVFVCTKD